MLGRLIVLIALIVAVVIIMKLIRNTPEEKKKNLYWKLGLSGLAIVLILLAVTGRIHWIGAMIGALIPIVRRSMPLLIRMFPLFQQYVGTKTQADHNGQPPPPQPNSDMDEDSAYAALGLSPGASKEEVIQAHRKMMQKVHPDRGGSDYLAAQINQAKELLIRNLS